MSVIEAVQSGFRLAGKSRNLVLVMFAFAFVWNLVNIPFNNQLQEPTAGVSAGVMALSLVFIAVSIFLQSGSLGYVHEVAKTGQSNFARFTESGKKFYLRILGISAIVGLFIIILAVVAALAILVGGDTPNAISIVVALILAAFGMYGVLLVFLAPYILIVEDAKVVDSIKASITVVKSNFMTVLGIGILLLLVGFGIGVILGAAFGLLGRVLQGVAGQVVFGFIGSFVNAYLGVVVTGAFMTYYLSLKSSPTQTA